MTANEVLLDRLLWQSGLELRARVRAVQHRCPFSTEFLDLGLGVRALASGQVEVKDRVEKVDEVVHDKTM